MNSKKFFSLLLCAVIIFTAMPFCASAQEYIGDYIEGEAIFEYTQTTENENEFLNKFNIPDELSRLGINSVSEINVDKIFNTGIKSNPDGTKTKSGYYIARFDGETEDVCNELKKLPCVGYASPNYLVEHTAINIPQDVTSPTSYYNSYTKWWFENLVQIPSAWEKFDTLGEGVVVAVLDTGFTVDHPDYTGRIWEDPAGNKGYNAAVAFKTSTDYNGSDISISDVTPVSGHGDNVASIIVGAAGYNRSVIGVAPGAKLMPIKVSRTKDILEVGALLQGVNYAIANNADIISMSLTCSHIPLLEAACQAAYDAGIIVIASAGNSESDATKTTPSYPAAYDFVIGVMACDPNGQLCNFSNYDPLLTKYNITAPGYRILGINGSSSTVPSAYSGTSQAAPIVAGLAALYLSVYPDHTPEEFRRSLINSSTGTVKSNPITVPDNTYYFPVVNALSLLEYPDVMPSVYVIPGSTAVIEDELSFVYGLEENYSSVEDYIGVNDGSIEIIPTENGNGTGSILRVLTNSGEPFRDYEIVIFGDTDGDAKCDGRDVLICDYSISGGSVPDCINFACDVDFDGEVNEYDSGIIARCGVFNDFVSQIR